MKINAKFVKVSLSEKMGLFLFINPQINLNT